MTSVLQTRAQHFITASLRSAILCLSATLLFSTLATGVAHAARSEPAAAQNQSAFAVQLVSYIDVHHLHAGSTFFVKVVDDWTALGCSLRSGQILEGKVVLASARVKKSSPSQLAISFDKTACLYNKATIDLVLVAAFFDASANIPNSPFPMMRSGIAQPGSASVAQRTFNIGSLELAGMSKGLERPTLKPGEVKGVKGLTLRVGAGPDRSSIFESTTGDVRLDKDTVLVLVPASIGLLHPSTSNAEVTFAPSSTPAAEPGEAHIVETTLSVSSVAPAASAPPSEFLPCEPPACNVDLPAAAADNLASASQSISMRPLGYAPRPQREMGELDHDDALAWLGSHQLMVAFNPHKLIPRDPANAWADTLRRVHAVVLDVKTRKIISTADWNLADRQPYLWQLSNDRVLVHVENELRILGEDMRVEARIPLDGPLAFVRISPNGELMAIAVTHERHSPELHAKLREALDSEPDEDVSIRILNKNSKVVAQAASTREIMPPILLNEGQVRMLAAPQAKYRLEMIPWQGEAKTIAKFTSSCLPSVLSFPPDLLFVTTCSPQNRVQEYRVLRPTGAVVLHGRSDPQNFGQSVIGTDEKFAVKVLHAGHAIVDGSAFRGDDIDYAEIRIYEHDGQSVKSIQIASPPPSKGGFALSSDGSQLAVLANSALNFYAAQ